MKKEITENMIADACMWYRHDFGLMDEKERYRLMYEAKEWILAFKKSGIIEGNE